MFDLVTVGHFSIDFIKQPGRPSVKPTLGGPPTYVSLAATNLGAKASVISKVGEDFPRRYVRWLESQGVDLSGLKKIKGASTTSFMLEYRGEGERQLILRNRAPPIEAQDIGTSVEAGAAHISPIANEITNDAIAKLRRQTSLVSLDPQGLLRRFRDDGTMYLQGMEGPEILRYIDVFKASQRETEMVTGESNLKKAIGRVHERGVSIVIVTKAAEGAILLAKGKMYQVPAAKPRVIVDTTGSGDVFIGAFMTEYVRGKDILWCAAVGSAASSFVIEKMGPRGYGSEKKVYERASKVYESISPVSRV